MQNIRNLLARPGFRYLVIGGCVYGFELMVIVTAQAGGASAVWAVVVAFTLGTALSFFLQKLVTFSDKRMHRHILVPQLVATAVLILWNLGFSVLVTKLLQRQLPAVATRTLALVVTTIWNFYLYKTRIFKTDAEVIG